MLRTSNHLFKVLQFRNNLTTCKSPHRSFSKSQKLTQRRSNINRGSIYLCYLIQMIKYLFDGSIQSQFVCILFGLTKDNGPPEAATVDLNDISNNCSSLRPVACYSQMLWKRISVFSLLKTHKIL